MPQELPGFYFDPVKNRYFPLKGPIPGSASAHKPPSQPDQEINICRKIRNRTSKLLQDRELYGNVITFNRKKCNFEEECRKIQVSQPLVCRYHGTEKIGDGALEQANIDLLTPEGLYRADVLLAGGLNGCLSFLEAGRVGQRFDYGVKYMLDHLLENQTEGSEVPGLLWRPTGASLFMPSNISCMKMCRKQSFHNVDAGSTIQNGLITTLGSETSGGSVYVLNLTEPLDINPRASVSRRRVHEVLSISCTIWTADCFSDASRAVIGTSLGAALVNLETGASSWVCRCKSDVLSQQLDQSGNVVLCGLRNGAILTVDIRQKQESSSARLIGHRIPYSSDKTVVPLKRPARNSTKQWFEVKGNISTSCTIFMPSSISCLVSLQLYDQYFLASSMDGLIRLYDHRLIGRGAVQSYEGHVNSHTRLQLGVDPSERFVMSGGEDCKLRIWSIKSGDLLFEDKFSNSVLSTLCWTRTGRIQDEKKIYEEYPSGQTHSWGAWLGSHEGLYHMHWS